MPQSFTEIILAYGFTIVLFAGLPAIIFQIIILPGLMRTTGETIGTTEFEGVVVGPISRRVPLPRILPKPLTVTNTA